MKKRIFCLFLSVLFVVFGMVPVYADGEAGGEVFPDDSIFYLDEEDDLGAGELELEEDFSIEHEEDEDLNAGELIEGETSLITIDDDDLGAGGEEITPENSETVEPQDDDLGAGDPEEGEFGSEEITEPFEPEIDDEDLNAGSPYISATASNLTIRNGSTATTSVAPVNTSGLVYMAFSVSDSSVCSASWGKYSGGRFPLNITAKKVGTAYITVYVKNFLTGKTICSGRIYVETYSNPALTVSQSSVSVNQGSAKSVNVSYSGFTGSVTLQFSVTNTTSYSCSWGKWSSKTVPLSIAGNKTGSGTVTITMKSSATKTTLATKRLSVYVVSNAKVTASRKSVSLGMGESVQVKVTYSNYSGSVYMSYSTTNTSAYGLKWGNWNGSTCPLTVTGKGAGSGTVYVYLKDSKTNSILAQTSFSVQAANKAKVTPSTSNFKVAAGSSGKLSFTVSGIYGTYSLSYSLAKTSYTSCKWGSWSGSTIPMTISGINKGTTTLTVSLLNSDNKKVASTNVTVEITGSQTKTPTLKLSPSPLNVKKGNTAQISVSYANLTESANIQYSISSPSYFSCSWGSQSGSSIPLTIKGTEKGKGSVTVYLKRKSDGTILAKASATVNVTDESVGTFKQLAYKFDNFRQAISLNLSRYMFGNNSDANDVYRLKYGAGGNCFGFATTSILFYTPDSGVNVSSFNSSKSYVSQLNRTDKNSSYKLTVEEFIIGMQASQYSNYNKQTSVSVSGLKQLVNTINTQMKSNKPVKLGIHGRHNGKVQGHAIVAYGVENVSSTKQRILIYDSNYPNETRYMELTKNSSGAYTGWSYELWDGLVWGSGKPDSSLLYSTYSNVLTLWSKRGHLGESGYNMLSTNAQSFTVFNVYNEPVAMVLDGILYTEDENISQVLVEEVMEGVSGPTDILLYLPVNLYSVQNNDESLEQFELNLVDEELGATVKTTADKVTICADDSCDIASVLMFDCKDEEYSISLLSSREGDHEAVSWEGIADHDTFSAMMEDGTYDACNLEAADFSLGELNGAENDSFHIDTVAVGKGSIECDNPESVAAGETRVCRIIPDEGYAIVNVTIDGRSIGEAEEYTFRNIDEDHVITAEFERTGEYLVGDVNADGSVNALDRMLLTRYLEEGDVELVEDMRAADIDDNGTVEVLDRLLLARYLAKWEKYNAYFEEVRR